MGIICSGGLVNRSPNILEDLPIDQIDPEQLSPDNLHVIRVNRLISVLQEPAPNIFKIYEVGRIVDHWTPEQRKEFYTASGVQHLIRLAGQYERNRRKDATSAGKLKRQNSDSMFDSHGVGFGTGSTNSHWNIKKTMEERRRDENVTISALHALRAYIFQLDINYGNPELTVFEAITIGRAHLAPDIVHMLNSSGMCSWFEQYLLNESVLDISEHMDLYVAICQLLCVFGLYPELLNCLIRPVDDSVSSGVHTRNIAHLLTSGNTSTQRKPMFACMLELRRTVKVYCAQELTGQFRDESFTRFAENIEQWTIFLATVLPYFTTEFRYICQTAIVEDTSATQSKSDDTDAPGVDHADARYIAAMKPYHVDTHAMYQADGKFNCSFSFEKEASNLQPFSVGLATRMSRITKEIAALRKSLPLNQSSSIFLRIDETRADVMKVLIIGPVETPYQNGCFEFDVFFPKNYPANPPKVSLVTTGRGTVRFNPNLYNDGKVCLSILNTWEGRPEERWNSTFSLLQVLVSIQALIFVKEPYFNEPGFERAKGSPYAQKESDDYNHRIKHATLQYAINEQLKSPPVYFKDVIMRHFKLKRDEIVDQAQKWIVELRLMSEATSNAKKDKTAMLNFDMGFCTHAMEATVRELTAHLSSLRHNDRTEDS